MSDVQTTIRRCTAFVCILLGVLVVQLGSLAAAVASADTLVADLSVVGVLTIMGASVYLVLSAIGPETSAPDREHSSGESDRGPGEREPE